MSMQSEGLCWLSLVNVPRYVNKDIKTARSYKVKSQSFKVLTVQRSVLAATADEGISSQHHVRTEFARSLTEQIVNRILQDGE